MMTAAQVMVYFVKEEEDVCSTTAEWRKTRTRLFLSQWRTPAINNEAAHSPITRKKKVFSMQNSPQYMGDLKAPIHLHDIQDM